MRIESLDGPLMTQVTLTLVLTIRKVPTSIFIWNKTWILDWIKIDRYLHNGQTVICEFEVTNLSNLDPRNIRFIGIEKGVHSVYGAGPQYSEVGRKARIIANRIITSLPSLHLIYTISESKFYYVLLEDAPDQTTLNSIVMKQITSANLNVII